MILHGRNLRMGINDVLIACSRSCEISIDSDTIEVANPTSGTWKKYIAGRKGWSCTSSGLVSFGSGGNIQDFNSWVGQRVKISFWHGSYGFFWGYAICTSAKITGTVGNLTQGSVTFQGDGELRNPSSS